MSNLITVLLVVVLIGLLVRRGSGLANCLDTGTSRFEAWLTTSPWHFVGIPSLVAAVTLLGFTMAGSAKFGASIFGTGFCLFCLYGVAHAVGGRSGFRDIVLALFITCFVGTILGVMLVGGPGA